ncbi:MAG: T9SS type A sorting domain-containing protein, partial [Saprospiraceae bacterium]
QYWVRIFEANCDSNDSYFNLNISANNPKSQRTRKVMPSIQSIVLSNVVLSGNTEINSEPIYTSNQPFTIHQPVDVFVLGNNKSKIILNVSNTEFFSFKLEDKLLVVSDGVTNYNPGIYGRLTETSSTSNNSIFVDYIHPYQSDLNPILSLLLNVLFDGELTGISIPLQVHISQNPLPTDLIDFEVSYIRKADINHLMWTTASEVNNDHFDIERSFQNFDFEYIGRINGAGNSSKSLDYYFDDINIPRDGFYSYRLKQVDTDGQANYSKPVVVHVSRAPEIKTGIYPNPTSEIIHCFVDANVGAKINIDIFNYLGQRVSQNTRTESLVDKKMTWKIDTKNFGKGMFMVVFTIDGIRYNHKLIILE